MIGELGFIMRCSNKKIEIFLNKQRTKEDSVIYVTRADDILTSFLFSKFEFSVLCEMNCCNILIYSNKCILYSLQIMDEIFSKKAWCAPVAVTSSSGLSQKQDEEDDITDSDTSAVG